MAMALYEPGLGYYANNSLKFGAMPDSGSDFVTAPEMSPLFARALAVQVRQALRACDSTEVWEFGAGSGALADQLLAELGALVSRYHVIELSGVLRARQAERLQAWDEQAAMARAVARARWGRRSGQRSSGCDAGALVVLGRRPLVRARRRLEQAAASSGVTDSTSNAPAGSGLASCPAASWRSILRPRLSCARWPSACIGRQPSSSTTAFPRPSTTTRSASRAP